MLDTRGTLPAWCADPDAAGKGRLGAMAQELGTLMLPGEPRPTGFQAGYMRDLAAAVSRAGVSEEGAMIPLEFRATGGDVLPMKLLWPVSDPGALSEAAQAPRQDASQRELLPDGAPCPASQPDDHPAIHGLSGPTTINDLPPYSRSLLRIRVPVVVTLAQKRQILRRIVELGPGSIIQFDKSCEETLDLDVGGHRVAIGEAVKVGDKFGLRITSIILPGERFQKVVPPGRSHRKAVG
jgi:flagellar motor switch/type III secretory pathway protein FliN